MDFLWGFLAGLALAGVIGGLLLTVAKDWQGVQNLIRELFLIAEKALRAALIESGPGAMEAVVVSLYPLLPGRAKIAIKFLARQKGLTVDEFLRQWVQRIYDSIVDEYDARLGISTLDAAEHWCTFVKRKL